MADIKISQLPSATTPLAGTEEVPLVQSGTTKKVTVSNLRGSSVTAVTATAPVVSSGGTTPVISMAAATTSVNGYLTSTDWNTFNNKLATNGSAANLTGLPLTTGVTGLLPVANGGTGTATPNIVAGTNVTVTGTWPNQTINSTASGTGDVVGPGSSTDNAVARFDSTTGKIIQNSGVVINDSGEITVGVWKGTEIGLPYGGTGASSASQARGNILPAYAGNAGKVLAVNVGATDVEYISAGGTGTVTSVAVSGGTTGLTTSGGPITAAGTITLAGTLAVASGGTGTATPALVAGTNVTITGTWPNQTINSSGGGSMTYPGAGIANSTGSAWGTSYSTTGSGTVVALATSPTFVTPVLGTPTSGDFSTGTFTWPTFNQNTTGTAAGLSTTLVVGSGGTGATTLTGYVKGSGTSALTASSTIPNTDITGLGTMSTQAASSVAITGGTINGATIGATTAAAVTGTVVTASTKVVSPYFDAVSSAGGALRNASGTSQIQWGGGGGNNVSVDVSTNLNGTNAQIDISPTGTGHVHINPTGSGSVEINPTSAGTMNNMAIGGTTPAAGAFTTVTATTPVAVTSGGTGQNSALTQYGVVFASTTGAMATTSAGTPGYVLTSNGSSAPTFQAASGGLSRAQTTAISLVYGF